MQQIFVCKGIPASGKSTWAKKLVDSAPGLWKRINRDSLRAMLDNNEWSPKNEKFIVDVRNQILLSALRKGYNVVVDDTNLRNDSFKEICELAGSLNKEIMVIEECFPIDLDEAIKRDSTRGDASVGPTVITNMWKKYVRGRPDVFKARTEFFYPRIPATLEQNADAPKAIICDLDGTLAIIGDRSPYDASRCDVLDKPNPSVVETVRLFHKAGYKILFVSGREEKDRLPTMRFIAKHLPDLCLRHFHEEIDRCKEMYLAHPKDGMMRELLDQEVADLGDKIVNVPMNSPNCELIMRKTGDQRKDTVIKREIYDNQIKDKYNIMCVIDDRPSVVRMWRYDLGMPVFQVNDKEF